MSKPRYAYKLGSDQHGEYAILTIKRRKVWIDADQIERVFKHSWYISPDGYAKTKIEGRIVAMQRLLLPTGEGLTVDHIDQCKLNNRRYNLRAAEHRQNVANGVRRRCKGRKRKQYYGISKTKYGWRADICYKYHPFWSRVFKYAWEAALAYDLMSELFNGEFASLNFPADDPRRQAVIANVPMQHLAAEKLRIDAAPKPPKSRYRGIFIVRLEPLRYTYDFRYMGDRHEGKIFKTEEEALAAMNKLLIELGASHRVQAYKKSEARVPEPDAVA